MEKSHQKAVSLGDEFDTVLWGRLLEILRSLGATSSESKYSMGGSQEVASYTVHIHSEVIHISAETYIGMTITGPSTIGDIEKTTARLAIASPLLTVPSYGSATQCDIEPLATVFRGCLLFTKFKNFLGTKASTDNATSNNRTVVELIKKRTLPAGFWFNFNACFGDGDQSIDRSCQQYRAMGPRLIRPSRVKGGRQPYTAVLMIKILVQQ